MRQELEALQLIAVGFWHFEFRIEPEKNVYEEVFHNRPKYCLELFMHLLRIQIIKGVYCRKQTGFVVQEGQMPVSIIA